MPLPLFLLGGLAAAVGIGGHIDAKETNEKAQKLSNDAQTLYNNTKYSLESAKNRSESSLKALGTTKKTVMETSVKQFLRAYDRIKDFQFSNNVESNELSKLMVNNNSVLQLQQMTDIYESAFSSGAKHLPSMPSTRISAMRFSALLLVFFAAKIVISLLGFVSVTFATVVTLILFVPVSLIAVLYMKF